MGVDRKSRCLEGVGGFTKYQSIGGVAQKKGAWTVCRFKGGVAEKRSDGIFVGGGVDTPIHTMDLVLKRALNALKTEKSCW